MAELLWFWCGCSHRQSLPYRGSNCNGLRVWKKNIAFKPGSWQKERKKERNKQRNNASTLTRSQLELPGLLRCFRSRKWRSSKPVLRHRQNSWNKIQAALVIRWFVISGFNYLQLINCIQNLLSADIVNMDIKMLNQLSLVIRGFGIRGILWERNE